MSTGELPAAVTPIDTGGVYWFRASVYDRYQRVRVRRISQDGHWVDVVGEYQGAWMSHGWRVRSAQLSTEQKEQPSESRT